MRIVSDKKEIAANVERVARYLRSGGSDGDYARALVQRGICFVARKQRGGTFFAPSRFVGYAGNSRSAHQRNTEKHGRVTNAAISRVLGSRPESSRVLERAYVDFCHTWRIGPRTTGSWGKARRFWELA